MSSGQPRTIVVGATRNPTVTTTAARQNYVILQSRSQTPTGTSQQPQQTHVQVQQPQQTPVQVQPTQQQIKVISTASSVQQKNQLQRLVGMPNPIHSNTTTISQVRIIDVS